MVGLPVGKNFELRPEFRVTSGTSRCSPTATKKNSVTGTLAALTYF